MKILLDLIMKRVVLSLNVWTSVFFTMAAFMLFTLGYMFVYEKTPHPFFIYTIFILATLLVVQTCIATVHFINKKPERKKHL